MEQFSNSRYQRRWRVAERLRPEGVFYCSLADNGWPAGEVAHKLRSPLYSGVLSRESYSSLSGIRLGV